MQQTFVWFVFHKIGENMSWALTIVFDQIFLQHQQIIANFGSWIFRQIDYCVVAAIVIIVNPSVLMSKQGENMPSMSKKCKFSQKNINYKQSYRISSHKTRGYYYFAKPSNTGFIRKHCILISKDIHTNLWKSSFMDSSQKIFFLKKLQKSGYFHFMAYMLNQCWAFSNDCLNLIFVKKFYVLGKKEPEMVVKWPLINRKFSWDFSYKIAEIWQLKNIHFIIVGRTELLKITVWI